MTTTVRNRPIIAVEILDQHGNVLADVDAGSTADALAYYLRSRHIDDSATEASVVNDAGLAGPDGDVRTDECIVRRTHDWDGAVVHSKTLVAALKACPAHRVAS